MSQPAFYKSRRFQLLVGLLVTAGCLAWAFHKMAADEDPRVVFRKIGDSFSQANYFWLAPYWLALAGFYWLKAWRWRLLLAPLRKFDPVRELLPPILIGFSFNNLLPARIGEIVRVVVFSRTSGLPATAVLASVALERILDAVSILALFGIGLLMVPSVTADVRHKALIAAAVAAVGVLGVAVYLIWTRPFVRFAAWSMNAVPVLPVSMRAKIARILETAAQGLASLKSGSLLAGILASSLAQWALNGVLVYCSLAAFALPASWPISLVLLGVVAFGVAAPSSPGYFGIIQLCFLLVMELFVADRERVFASSIFFHMAQYVPVTLAGLIYFNRLGLRLNQLQESDAPARAS